ncbi:two-component system phosphate regulon response regulator PhoB [Natronospira proteinivora]|uniref:Phosphate regulon transcriptional regulatory protein PhoB n=1 Tax=Natronospira proteinivora TaxID=1807133 RepID=A0ABT1G5F8_9GAMM|nr:phosphate regulon transcriptional regulator PhoB [Natronospira proteinivora]MCP1726536.1 two-component system phosphate regulon response regulator PhoB [Natronospira proteinivora]
MSEKRILVVEDDAAIREMVAFALRRAEFEVVEAEDVAEARIKVAEQPPDLLVLDWMLPDMSGLEYARTLKRDEATRELPIIMLTARAEEEDKLRGFESGVDDYVTKPFSSREMIARIQAVLRRAAPDSEQERVSANGLEVNLASHRVLANGQAVDLGPTEYRLLTFFMTHPDRVYTRTQLLDRVWGNNVYVEERTVDVHIRRLRKALAPSGHDDFVQTVRGAGYRFTPAEGGA